MRKILLVFIFLFLLDLTAFAWDLVLGSSGYDDAKSAQLTHDGGFIVVGHKYNYDEKDYSDLWLIKLDLEGNVLWNKYFSYDYDSHDYGTFVQQTTDNGFIITGNCYLNDKENSKVLLIKTDPEGNEEWFSIFKHDAGSWEGESVQQTSDNGYIIVAAAGYYSSAWLIKTDSEGNELWRKNFGGKLDDWIQSIKETTDHGFILCGTTESFAAGRRDAWLVKTDSLGELEWSKTYGDSFNQYGYSVLQTSDNGFIFTGSAVFYGSGKAEAWLVKTDQQGNQIWDRTYGGPEDETAFSLQMTPDQGYILAGYTKSFSSGGNDFLLIKTDSDGNQEWSRTFGGAEDDFCYSVAPTAEDSYLMVGSTESYGAGYTDAWLVYYTHNDNLPPYPPTLLTPENGEILDNNLVNFTWINNGDPDNDAVGSWLYIVGPLGQVISFEMGAAGFMVGEELSFNILLFSKQEWAWTVYIYDPNQSSQPYYNFQQPFWTFTISDN